MRLKILRKVPKNICKNTIEHSRRGERELILKACPLTQVEMTVTLLLKHVHLRLISTFKNNLNL